MTIQGGFSG